VTKGLKIAIGGKGGVGKTTVCAVWSHLFAEDGFNVMAIDADPNATLASAFGIPPQDSPRPLIEMKELISERTGTTKDSLGVYFKMNPRVSDLPEQFWLDLGRIKLLVLGAITQAGAGCACAEGVFLKALLMHTILQRQEVVLVDLAAGVECMGRASVAGIDAMVVVVEPGSRSIETANSVAKMARELGIKTVGVIGNKGIIAYVLKIGADKTERFFLVSPFYFVNFFYRLFIKEVASHSVHGIGRIYDDATFFQNLDCFLNQSHLGIFAVYRKHHEVFSLAVLVTI